MASNRICYDNVLSPTLNASELSEDCDMDVLKPDLYYEVGFGSSVSKGGDLYAVVIYLTRQESRIFRVFYDLVS